MQPVDFLKKTEKSLISFFGYIIAIISLVLGLFYFMTGFHLIVLLIGIPYLIRLAYSGFPLGYYKLTGKPYEYSLGKRKELEKDKQYYIIADIGQTSGKQLLSQCALVLIIISLLYHWYSTIVKVLMSEAMNLLGKVL